MHIVMATMNHNFAGKMEHQCIKEINFRQIKIPSIANFQLIAKYYLSQNLLTYSIQLKVLKNGKYPLIEKVKFATRDDGLKHNYSTVCGFLM